MLPFRICQTIATNAYIKIDITGRSSWGSGYIKVPGHLCFYWDDEGAGGQGA
ncbi:hypothetical protein JF110_001639 [Campylobacter jejuni]|nr:hypothetical protein [Campylobacter jejuni]